MEGYILLLCVSCEAGLSSWMDMDDSSYANSGMYLLFVVVYMYIVSGRCISASQDRHRVVLCMWMGYV
jgi:hypothetical protein